MCEVQSSVIHSSTTQDQSSSSVHPAPGSTSLWDLASSELAWSAAAGVPAAPYQPHPLWAAGASDASPPGHPGQYQPELFGFGGDFWSGARSGASRQLLQYQKTSKKRRRVATASQRRAANIRERRRMFNLNEAFDRLRSKVPTFAYEKRLSRIETLRLAITYINFMDELLSSPLSAPSINNCRRSAQSNRAAGGVHHLPGRHLEELHHLRQHPYTNLHGLPQPCQTDLEK